MRTLIILALFVRLSLSFLPALRIDMASWQGWSQRMAEVGPAGFYSPEVFTAYPPTYLYILWIFGLLQNHSDFLLKLPANLADLAAGYLVYLIIKKRQGEKPGRLGFLLYVFNPAIWFNSAVFGQLDGIGALFGLLAFYFLWERKNLTTAAATFTLAWTIKPQAISLAPALGLIALSRFKPREWLKAAAVFSGLTLLLYWPFFPANPLGGVITVFKMMNNLYTCTTCFAFNFWGIWGNWQEDKFLWLGIILFSAVLAVIFWRRKTNPYWQLALTVLAFNQLMTRMHERYMLPFFVFTLAAVLQLKSKKLFAGYFLFSLLNFLNVFYVYAYYNTGLRLTPWLITWLNLHFRLMSLLSFGAFAILLGIKP